VHDDAAHAFGKHQDAARVAGQAPAAHQRHRATQLDRPGEAIAARPEAQRESPEGIERCGLGQRRIRGEAAVGGLRAIERRQPVFAIGWVVKILDPDL
jgi:hypothetical protein